MMMDSRIGDRDFLERLFSLSLSHRLHLSAALCIMYMYINLIYKHLICQHLLSLPSSIPPGGGGGRQELAAGGRKETLPGQPAWSGIGWRRGEGVEDRTFGQAKKRRAGMHACASLSFSAFSSEGRKRTCLWLPLPYFLAAAASSCPYLVLFAFVFPCSCLPAAHLPCLACSLLPCSVSCVPKTPCLCLPRTTIPCLPSYCLPAMYMCKCVLLCMCVYKLISLYPTAYISDHF